MSYWVLVIVVQVIVLLLIELEADMLRWESRSSELRLLASTG